MLKIIEKIRARKECADKGHMWRHAGTAWDCDGGMGGGRPIQKLSCGRCGARASSVFGIPGAPAAEGTADA